MGTARWQPSTWATLFVLSVGIGCGGNGDGSTGNRALTPTPHFTLSATATPTVTRAGSPTPTTRRTPSATPTSTPAAFATPTASLTPVAGALEGLAVIRREVPSGPQDAVAPPPAGWAEGADVEAFDRGLGRATLRLVGEETVTVESNADGTFTVPRVPPGLHRLEIEKVLNGNLVRAAVPLPTLGRGRLQVLVQVGWGELRVVAWNGEGQTVVSQVATPTQLSVLLENGRLVGINHGSRSWRDEDGDGVLEPIDCSSALWECGEDFVCEDGSQCSCTASCPMCEDCGPGVCGAFSAGYVYRCDEGLRCAQPGDVCVCVASCPTCTDCPRRVCIPECAPLEIKSIEIVGVSEVVLGRSVQLQAIAHLSNGTVLDVTRVVSWRVSDDTVAAIDSWGQLYGKSIAAVDVSATLGEISSAPFTVRVVERSSLQRIVIRNLSCSCPMLERPPVAAGAEAILPPCMVLDRPAVDPAVDLIPVPWCGNVVLVGRTLQLAAIAEYQDGSVEDLTDQVRWRIDPPTAATIERGMLRTLAAAELAVSAEFRALVSEPLRLRVVDRPTAIALRIFAEGPVAALRQGGSGGAVPPQMEPCADCDYVVPVLVGDTLPFRASLQYDTGEWEEVTERVTWHVSDDAIASFTSPGSLVGKAPGNVRVEATLGELKSNSIGVRVVAEASVTTLFTYVESNDRVVAKGASLFLRANAMYDLGFVRDVTHQAVWRSRDDAVGTFVQPGELRGVAAGITEVWAEFAGVASNRIALEVYETRDINYCDPSRVNRAVWSDAFNRVVLESDCERYDIPSTVTLRYTVTETQPHGGIFDPCLDLYVYRGSELVRVLREEGCGEPFLSGAAPGRDEAVLRYQTLAFWDLRDRQGNLVPPGVYRVYGRFFLYYDPIVYLDIVVGTPGSAPTPTPVPLGAGCFAGDCAAFMGGIADRASCCAYARTNLGPLSVSWCERIADGKCLPGACQPACEEEVTCCPPNAVCLPEVPPCDNKCCPPTIACNPVDLPPCRTCTDSSQIRPCTPDPGAACPAVWMPVCGCDGRTYSNRCALRAACVQEAHEGPCVAAPAH